MSRKIYICDFNDSFTYNIFSILNEYDETLSIEVVPFKRLLNFFQVLENEDEQAVIILGPGPGHPQDYQFLFNSISRLLKKENFSFMGICLGHQIIWEIYGALTDYSGSPVHGHVAHYNIPQSLSKALGIDQKVEVQRYNSLAVKVDPLLKKKLLNDGWQLFFEDSELIISHFKNIVTYQFHPESIGTSCPKSFFRPVSEFLL